MKRNHHGDKRINYIQKQTNRATELARFLAHFNKPMNVVEVDVSRSKLKGFIVIC